MGTVCTTAHVSDGVCLRVSHVVIFISGTDIYACADGDCCITKLCLVQVMISLLLSSYFIDFFFFR